MTLRCQLCGDHLPAGDIDTHLRRMHPDRVGDAPQWTRDGRLVIHDTTGTPPPDGQPA